MANKGSGSLLENVKTIVYALLIALGIRTVAFEPFNIPSGSMIPTLLVGDYLFVSKYSYGYSRYSLPFSPRLWSGRILGHVPERGDVAVFRLPREPSTNYIKRIIGLPGDRVQMKSGQLFINGTLVPRTPAGPYTDSNQYGLAPNKERGFNKEVSLYGELLPNGRKHDILKLYEKGDVGYRSDANDTQEFNVPQGHVFAMGDNRDNSQDSRYSYAEGVGFVPLENLVGRAEFIFFSVDATAPWWQVWEWPREIRWSRLLHGIS